MEQINTIVNLELIKKVRKARKLRQKDMAQFLKIAPTTYHGWETGARNIDINKVPLLCKILGLEPNDIFLS